jgi:hypothetical protein
MGMENIKKIGPDKDKTKSPLDKLEELKKQKREELEKQEKEKEKLRKEQEEKKEKESIERYLSEKSKLDDLISQRDGIRKRLEEIKSRQAKLIGEYHETVKEARKDKTAEDILHTKEGFETVFSDLMTERKDLAKEAEELNKKLKEIESQIPLQEEKVKDLFYKTPEGIEQKKREEEREYLKKYIDLDKLPPISQIKERGLDALFSNFNKEEFKNLSEEEKEKVKQLIIKHISYDIDSKLTEKFDEINEKTGVNNLMIEKEKLEKKLEGYDEKVDEICKKLDDLNKEIENYLNEYKKIIEGNESFKKHLEEEIGSRVDFIAKTIFDVLDFKEMGPGSDRIDMEYWKEALLKSKEQRKNSEKPVAYDLDKFNDFFNTALKPYEEFKQFLIDKSRSSYISKETIYKKLNEIRNKYDAYRFRNNVFAKWNVGRNIMEDLYNLKKEYKNVLNNEEGLKNSLKGKIIKGAELYLDKIYSEKELDKANKEIEANEKEKEYFKNLEERIYDFRRFFNDALKYREEDEKKIIFNNEGKPEFKFVNQVKEEINKINNEIKEKEEEIKIKEQEKKEIESKLLLFSKNKKIEEKNKEIEKLKKELESLNIRKSNLEMEIRFTEDERYEEAMKFITEELPQLEKDSKIKEETADSAFNYEAQLKNGDIDVFFLKFSGAIFSYIKKLDFEKSTKIKEIISPYKELEANIKNINDSIKSSLDNLDKIKIEDLTK